MTRDHPPAKPAYQLQAALLALALTVVALGSAAFVADLTRRPAEPGAHEPQVTAPGEYRGGGTDYDD